MTLLTKKNIKDNLSIYPKQCPEWGATVIKNSYNGGWVLVGNYGHQPLLESDYKHYAVR